MAKTAKILSLLLLISILAACGSDRSSSPKTRSTTHTTPQPTPPAMTQLRVYYLQGEKLKPYNAVVPKTLAKAKAAITVLLENEGNYPTSIPKGTKLNSVKLTDKILTVDLSSDFSQGSGSLAIRSRTAQIIMTGLQFDTVSRVRILIDGQAQPLGGEGLIVSNPMDMSDFEDLLPAILVENPLPNQIVSCPLRVFGTANVFEAIFQIKLANNLTRVQASSGTGTRGSFDVTIPCSLQGKHTLTAFEPSAKDGSPINIQTIQLTFK